MCSAWRSGPRPRRLLVLTLAVGLFGVGGCSGSRGSDDDASGDEGSIDEDEPWAAWEASVEWPLLECDALDPNYCAFPYPSNVYTVDEAETPTGRRVQLSSVAMPPGTQPEPWNRLDGFSAGVPAMAHFPDATDTGLPGFDDIPLSITDDSPTLLINAETGERVPHIAELDMSHDDASRRTLMVRPVVRLEDGTRYIVAIRRLVDAEGEVLPANDAFQALKAGTGYEDDPSIEQRRGLYADIFRRLVDQGVLVSELQLAWDFTTSSVEKNTSWMLHMRAGALASIGPDGHTYVIKSVETDYDPQIAFRLIVGLDVPQYLTDDSHPGLLNLGSDGMPEPLGTATYDVEILIPKQAEQAPVPVVQYGHGLFGNKSEVTSGHLLSWAEEYGYAMFAMDLYGMRFADQIPIAALLQQGTFEEFESVVHRQHQGLLNWLIAMRMMKTSFANDPTYGQYIDPNGSYYYGISQGGIFGGTYMTLSTDIERGCLGVPGQPYRVLLARSKDFDTLFAIARATWEDPRDIMLMLTHAQHLWDRTSPNGYTHRLDGDPLPNTPNHEALLRIAKGDHQVTPFGGHIMARSVGATHLDTGGRSIFGLELATGPIDGSTMVEFDFGLPDDPLVNQPQRECSDPHGDLRKTEEARLMLDGWFRGGTVTNTCADGLCSFPDLSGCD